MLIFRGAQRALFFKMGSFSKKKMPGKEALRDSDRCLIDFERPTRQLNMSELESMFLQTSPSVLLGQDAMQYGNAEATVDWGNIFDQLQGTFINPRNFVSWFDVANDDVDRIAELLTSNQVSTNGEPLVSLRKGNTVVNFFAGCNCEAAIAISNIGSAGNFDTQSRDTYQNTLFSVAQNVFRRNGIQARKSLGIIDDAKPVIIIDDDCGASVVTTASSLRCVDRVIGLDKFSAQQINLAVATAHSIGMSVLEANRLDIPTEINIGWGCWGLTEGIGPRKDHKNYLANVDGFDSTKKTGIFGVGDMGDLSARTGSLTSPIEQLRQDNYYARETAKNVVWFRTPNLKLDLRLAFAMGGLLIDAMRRLAGGSDGSTDNLIMARASRQSNDGKFYAVFSDFVAPLYRFGYRMGQ